jgi:2'-5' RNA ligase
MVTGRVAAEIDGLRRALSSSEIDRISAHVTLVPPVNVAEADVGAVCDLLRSVAADFGPLELDLGPPSSFLPVNPVCYLTVSGERDVLVALASLASRLGTGPLSSPPDRRERPFVPHATINQHMAPERIAAAVEVLEGYRAHVVFERATLLEYSETERRWRVLCDAAFGPPARRGRGGIEIELSFSRHPDPEVRDWSRRTWEQYSVSQYGPDVHPDEPFTIAARVHGELAGVAEGEVGGLTCRLARLMVGPEWRSTGVGTQLLRATEDHAIESGCVRVRLETLSGSRAEGYYRGRGYEIVGNLSRWRMGRDFVVMEASLPRLPGP